MATEKPARCAGAADGTKMRVLSAPYLGFNSSNADNDRLTPSFALNKSANSARSAAEIIRSGTSTAPSFAMSQ